MTDTGNGVIQLLRPSEAARALGFTLQTMANLRHTGRGPKFVKLGTAVRYSADALRDWVEANTQTRTPGDKREKPGAAPRRGKPTR